MIQKETFLNVLDNSGVFLVKCIGVYGGQKKRTAGLGDTILVSLQNLKVKSKATRNFKKGEVLKAIVIQTKKDSVRKSNFQFSFGLNSVILLSSQEKPVGTKIKALVPKELRERGSLRVAAIASGLI